MTDQNNEQKNVSGLDEEPLFTPGDPGNPYLPPLPSEGDEDAYEEEKSPARRVWDRYSYTALRIYLTQFAIGIFGGSLAYSLSAKASFLLFVSSVFSILFFGVMAYAVAWNAGASDRISVDSGRRKKKLYVGALLGLAAGIPNFLLATLNAIGIWFGISAMQFLSYVAMTFSEGMYFGTILWFAGLRGSNTQELNSAIATATANTWWIYFAIALVTVLIVAVSYLFGYFNVGAPRALTNKGEEAERVEREKRAKPKQK